MANWPFPMYLVNFLTFVTVVREISSECWFDIQLEIKSDTTILSNNVTCFFGKHSSWPIPTYKFETCKIPLVYWLITFLNLIVTNSDLFPSLQPLSLSFVLVLSFYPPTSAWGTVTGVHGCWCAQVLGRTGDHTHRPEPWPHEYYEGLLGLVQSKAGPSHIPFTLFIPLP